MRVLILYFDAETQVTFVYRHDSFFQSVRRGPSPMSCANNRLERRSFVLSRRRILPYFIGTHRERLPTPGLICRCPCKMSGHGGNKWNGRIFRAAPRGSPSSVTLEI